MDPLLPPITGYEYSKPHENGTQYDTNTFEYADIIDAKYTRTELYPGNAMIEALPKPLPDSERIRLSIRRPDFNHDEIIKLSSSEQCERIEMIEKGVRIYLPMEVTIYNKIRLALIRSYCSRKPQAMANTKANTNGNPDYPLESPVYVLSDGPGDPTIGIFLYGTSGSGKSTSLKNVLLLFPHVIRHKLKNGVIFHQIVYLAVTCPNNSNFRELYKEIGKAIDKALGLGNLHIFRNYLTGKDRTSLGELNGRLEALIEIFGIGIIILDEAQNLHFNSAYDNSVNQLLNLSNSTGVAFCMVGTQFFDANYKFDSDSKKTVRRLGNEIKADTYCGSKGIFLRIAEEFSKYQLFEPEITLVERRKNPETGELELVGVHELIDPLYEATSGSIGAFATLWIAMNEEYIECNGHATIDTAFMNEVIHKRCRHYFEIISNEQATRAKLLLRNATTTLLKSKKPVIPKSFQVNPEDLKSLEPIVNHVVNMLSENYKGIATTEMINDAVSKSLTYLTKRHKEISADSLRVQANLTITKTIKKLVQLTSAAQEETVQVDYIEDYQKKQQTIGLPEGE